VACKPAVQISLLLFVARDAKTHLERDARQTIKGLNLAMTLFAHDLLLDVPFVVEKDVLRQIVDLDPRCRRLGIEIVVFLSYLRVTGDNVLVTIETFFHRRDPREGRTVHIRVTELALDLLHSRVHPVAEGDRLLRAKALDRHEVEKIEPDRDDSQAAEDHQDG
jgi:hypothetical protein